eukprot:TRINITY_DN904_c0_g1_i1.p1 TRINITY_DN904_c0_g1~~TRINITY_DN904_c0_g1_i1.p1  ORF type:complete len:108 (-),score=30.75 TRINITY_DN904_c0_g1_i1:167-448(-)
MEIKSNNAKDVIVWATADEMAVPNPEVKINWGCPCIAKSFKESVCRRPFAGFLACTLDAKDKGLSPEACLSQLQAFDECLKKNNLRSEDFKDL